MTLILKLRGKTSKKTNKSFVASLTFELLLSPKTIMKILDYLQFPLSAKLVYDNIFLDDGIAHARDYHYNDTD